MNDLNGFLASCRPFLAAPAALTPTSIEHSGEESCVSLLVVRCGTVELRCALYLDGAVGAWWGIEGLATIGTAMIGKA